MNLSIILFVLIGLLLVLAVSSQFVACTTPYSFISLITTYSGLILNAVYDSISILNKSFMNNVSDPDMVLLCVSALVPFFIIFFVLISISVEKCYYDFKVYERLVLPFKRFKCNIPKHGFILSLGNFVYEVLIGKFIYVLVNENQGFMVGPLVFTIKSYPGYKYWLKQVSLSNNYQFYAGSIRGLLILFPIVFIFAVILMYFILIQVIGCVTVIFSQPQSFFCFGDFYEAICSCFSLVLSFFSSEVDVSTTNVLPILPHKLARKFIQAKEKIMASHIQQLFALQKESKNIPLITQELLDSLLEIKPTTIKFTDNTDTNNNLIRGVVGKRTSEDSMKYVGVYIWENLITGEKYVGSSVNLAKRIRGYFWLIDKPEMGRRVNRSISEYGISNFSLTFYIVSIGYDKSTNVYWHMAALEQYYILTLNPALNVIAAVATVPMGEEIVYSPEQKFKKDNAISIPLYIYDGDVLVFQGISTAAVARQLGYSTALFFPRIHKEGEPIRLLYNRYLISQNPPTVDTPVCLVSPEVMTANLEQTKAELHKGRNVSAPWTNPSAIGISIQDLNTLEIFHVKSLRNAAKFTKDQNREVSYSHIRSTMANKDEFICNGWKLWRTKK